MNNPHPSRARLRVVAFALAVSSIVSGVRAQSPNAGIVSEADSFLATLTPEQLKKIVYAYNDAGQRARWSNFPTGFVPRGGISLKEMSNVQRDAAMKLLATVLSPMGLDKVNEIRQADEDFKSNGSKRGPLGSGGPPAGPPPGSQTRPRPPNVGPGISGAAPPGPPRLPAGDLFGSDLYYVSLLGTPSTTSPWMLQFGGHHLALNISIAASQRVLTPTLTGAQPATFNVNGRTIRPLGRESDKALALLRALDDQQRRQAVLSYTVADLVLGPGQDGKTIVAEGLRASAMNSKQRAMLLDLVGEWTGIINEPSAAARMTEVTKDLNETWFAWSGPTAGKSGENIAAYYRIQGPHLVIEYAPQHDEPTNHVHTMYRDPTNDYGAALTTQ